MGSTSVYELGSRFDRCFCSHKTWVISYRGSLNAPTGDAEKDEWEAETETDALAGD